MGTGKARGRSRTLNLGDYAGGKVGDGVLLLHFHGDGAFTGQVRHKKFNLSKMHLIFRELYGKIHRWPVFLIFVLVDRFISLVTIKLHSRLKSKLEDRL